MHPPHSSFIQSIGRLHFFKRLKWPVSPSRRKLTIQSYAQTYALLYNGPVSSILVKKKLNEVGLNGFWQVYMCEFQNSKDQNLLMMAFRENSIFVVL